MAIHSIREVKPLNPASPVALAHWRAGALQLAFLLALSLTALLRKYLPHTPVPLTLQVFFVFWAAMTLGARRSMPVVAAYVALGAAGLPVFAGGVGGWAYLFGAGAVTAGYIFGFFPVAALVGRLISRAPRVRPAFDAAILALGLMTLYLCGALWMKLAAGLSWPATLSMSAGPFILVDIAKLAAAYALFRLFEPRTQAWLKPQSGAARG